MKQSFPCHSTGMRWSSVEVRVMSSTFSTGRAVPWIMRVEELALSLYWLSRERVLDLTWRTQYNYP